MRYSICSRGQVLISSSTVLALGSVAGISARDLIVRQQYGTSDRFGFRRRIGTELIGSGRMHIGARSCQQVRVAVRCKRRVRGSRERGST